MNLLQQIKLLSLGALAILVIAYCSKSFDIQTAGIVCLVIMFICAEIQSKQRK